jgi:hypothetical protein
MPDFNSLWAHLNPPQPSRDLGQSKYGTKFCLDLFSGFPMVLDQFTENSFHRKCLTERSFDQNIIWPNTVWPNAIWPNVHSTESPFNRTPIDRKFIYRKVIWPNLLSTKNSFNRKNCAQARLTENSFDWKFGFSENDHLTETSFFRKFIWPKAFFEKWLFDRMFFYFLNSIFRKKLLLKWTFGHMSFRSFD